MADYKIKKTKEQLLEVEKQLEEEENGELKELQMGYDELADRVKSEAALMNENRRIKDECH